MTYLVTYGIYLNCSISGVEEREIEADSAEEAKALAEELADALEREIECEGKVRGRADDVWACVEDIQACDEGEEEADQ